MLVGTQLALVSRRVEAERSGKYTHPSLSVADRGVAHRRRPATAPEGVRASFEWEASDDGISSAGQAEFEEVDAAKAAIDKYDGMDMGLGTKLAFEAL